MLMQSKKRFAAVVVVMLAVGIFAWQTGLAQDVVHDVTGIVKHVDHATKTVVIKTADGTEQTFKYSGKTVVEGSKDAAKGTDDASKAVAKGTDDTGKAVGKGVGKGAADTYFAGKEGSKVTIHYTEKGAEKTAVGVKDAVD